MREISAADVTKTVARLAIEANYDLPADALAALRKALATEESPEGKEALRQILKNDEIAATERMAMCQDCGLAVIFVELGQDVHLVGGNFRLDALHLGEQPVAARGKSRQCPRPRRSGCVLSRSRWCSW